MEVMPGMVSKYDLYRLVLRGCHVTGFHRAFHARTAGLGTILTLHHVRPYAARAFCPNRILEITPAFLDAALTFIKAKGYDIVPLDDVPARLRAARPAVPFVAITLDDGYLDTIEHALPVFRRHKAPFTAFVTTGFADATATLWWLDLEMAIAALPEITVELDEFSFKASTRTDGEKTTAFAELYRLLRAGDEFVLRKVVADLAGKAEIDPLTTVRSLCMSWDELRGLAEEPLASIGAHTLTHPMLAKHNVNVANHEIADSRNIIANELGIEVNHFAYPVGDPASAGQREFEMAKKDGFLTAVTTRPGMLFKEHAKHLHALPRLSLNGLFQSEAELEVLLSGLPFALLNHGRRLNVD